MDMIGDLFETPEGSAPNAAAPSRDRRPPPGAVFFAVKPDDDAGTQALARAEELRTAHKLRDKPRRELLHVTLFAIGNFPDLPKERLDAAIRIAAAFRMAPFDITLDRALTFNTRKPKLPLVLAGSDGIAKVRMLRQALLGDMKRAGIRPTAGSDESHMTLLYDPLNVPERPIEPIRWTVRDFVLVHSHYGLGKHDELGRWPLRA
jgi:RNA 2',3'-cyclic 3'-phosphodiesterase